MDVAARSLYGRCEEWQILLVAICRTLGLPARPASTPWWAHQDDNHAWAEIYINGAWHYDGDYYPDQNWFSGLADKMVLIVADGSLPAQDDEVLSQDEYGAVVNSIKHYAGDKTRTIKLRVSDSNGNPVSKCPIAIDVYNTNGIRPQAYTYTDEKGEKSLTVGQGAFYLMVFKDSLAALQYVPSGGAKEQFYTLLLDKTSVPAQTSKMHYPNRRVTFLDSPQSWRDDNKAASDAWQKKSDDYELLAQKSFMQRIAGLDTKQAKALSDSLFGTLEFGIKPQAIQTIGIRNYCRAVGNHLPEDSLFYQVLKRTRMNMHFWLGFDSIRSFWDVKEAAALKHLDKHKAMPPAPPIDPEWLKIILENDEKDLWQPTNGWFFGSMYKWFKYIYPRVSYLPREELLNLLEPTVFYENLPGQSHYLWSLCVMDGLYPKKMILSKPLKPSPQQVIKHFQKKHQLKIEKAISGLLPLETAYYQKYLTGYQYKILAVAYLRANQIPANYTRIPYVVAVYTDSTWKYFDINKNDYYQIDNKTATAGAQTRKVTFNCADEFQQPVSMSPQQIQICFLKDGQFFPTNEQPDYQGNGVFTAEIPLEGSFYAQIGYRQSDSLTVYFLRPLSENGQPLDVINLTCNNFPRNWSAAESFLSPVIAELEKQGYSYAVLGNYTLENSLRMATKLQEANQKFLMVGYETGKVSGYDYAVLTQWHELTQQTPSLRSRTITLIKSAADGSWKMYEGLWNKLP
jgi:hypothetical protein